MYTVSVYCYVFVFIFIDGVPPDGTPVKVYSKLWIPIKILVSLLGISGIIIAIFCLVFTVVYRNHK